MIFKLAGMIFIIMTTALGGISFSKSLSERVKRLELIVLMLDRMSTYIEFRALHTGEILSELSSDKSFEQLKFLTLAAELYKSGESFHDAWMNAVENDASLKNEERAQLLAVGNSLGRSNTKGQLSMISIHSCNIKHICKTASVESQNKGKLYRTLGILTGVFISVMLI